MNFRRNLLSVFAGSCVMALAVPAFAGGGQCDHGKTAAQAQKAQAVQVDWNQNDATAAFDPTDYTDAPFQFSRSRQIDASPDRVFAVLSDHEGMPDWMPKVSNVATDYSGSNGVNGTGAVRFCQFGKDELVEDIVYLNAAQRVYAYSVNRQRSKTQMPFESHLAVIQVTSDGNGGSIVEWSQYVVFEKGLKSKLVKPMISRLMKKGMKNVEKNLAKEAETDLALR